MRRYLIVCFVNFLIAALMGLTLRLSQVMSVSFEYSNLLHAHSHTAMLGWAYLTIFTLAVRFFANDAAGFKTLFWLTQASVIGMMIAFPIQGYGPVSIAFSTLHIIFSYAFAWRIWKFTKESVLFRAALVLMAVSTLGAWSVGLVGATAGKESALYKLAIQFFLHFQFNGWFFIAVIALGVEFLKRSGREISKPQSTRLSILLVLSAILTFGLAAAWSFDSPIFPVLNLAGSILQIVATTFVLLWWQKAGRDGLLVLAAVSIGFKAVFQILTVMPGLADASSSIRSFAVGFIHLTMLGAVSSMLLYLIQETFGKLKTGQLWKSGIAIFAAGFIATEVLLFLKGAMQFAMLGEIPFFETAMLFVSALLPFSLLLLLLQILKNRDI